VVEARVELRVLGPVELYVGGRACQLGPPQRRLVIAALALDAGHVVTTETLIDRVWAEAPEGARRTVQVQLTEIRRTLKEAGAPIRVLRRSGGYVLDVDPDRVDVLRARRLMAEARDPVRADRERVDLLDEALTLWHAEPLAGLGGEWAARTRQTLRQLHVDVVLAWSQAQLRQGNAGVVIEPLTGLSGEHPLVESLAAALMRALYAVGRTSEALDRYADVRARLADELGTDPGPELRHVHQSILRGEPTAGGPRPAPRPVVPAQLPMDVDGFTGRVEELERLDAVLARRDSRPTAVVVAVVWGSAGVGKTTLAIHWAHRVRGQFPDGQLYVNLRGFDPSGPAMPSDEALRGFLGALGVAADQIPVGVEAQVGLYRSLMDGRRMLVVADNARDAQHVRPLLPGSPGCVVVVTGRNQLAGLVTAEGAHPVTLGLLSTDEARSLLAHRLGGQRVAAEPDAVDRIVVSCARLPLALAVVAARAATYPELPLAALAAELGDAGRGLDAFASGDAATDVRAVFSWSYRSLSDGAARLFRSLGHHPGPDLAAPAAASLAGVAPGRIRPLLAELTGAHLLTEQAPGRFAMHDLLRAYAVELAGRYDDEAAAAEALERLIDHYRQTGRTASILIDPLRDVIAIEPPRPGVTPEPLADYGQAMAWCTAERAVVVGLVHDTAARGLDAYPSQLAWTLETFFDRRGHWHELIAMEEAALAAAHRRADPAALAHAERCIGRAHMRLGRHHEARGHLRRAVDLYAGLRNETGQAHVSLELTRVAELEGDFEAALAHSRRALDLYGAVGYRAGQARALNNIGWHSAQLGDYEAGLTHCQQALTLHLDLGNRHGEANTCDSLGYIYHHLGRYEQAIARYRRAVDLFREVGDRYYEADALTHLGDTYRAAGDEDSARAAWASSIELLDQLGHADADRVRIRLQRAGDPSETIASPT
jgi:DNA-binding SARP family transcriptional activator/tetratricopeptide (TPR) repeat protein